MRTFLVAMTLMTGCATPTQSFRPTAVAAQTRGGDPAAAYDVREATGPLAQVIVWSQGAFVAADRATIVHIGAEVQNVGAGALAFDVGSVGLEAFDVQGVPLSAARLVSMQPQGSEEEPISPGIAKDVDLFFALPGVEPAAIGSLRMRWALSKPDGARYTQFTDFTRDRPSGDVYVHGFLPIFGFYHPFFGPVPGRIFVIHHAPVRRVVVPSRPARRYR